MSLRARCESLSSEAELLRKINAELSGKNSFLGRKMGDMENDLTQTTNHLEKVTGDHRLNVEERLELEMKLKNSSNENNSMRQDLRRLTDENETLKANVENLKVNFDKVTIDNRRQVELIRQLQSLQKDTEGVMKNQETVYNTEKKNYQSMYYETSAKLKEAVTSENELRRDYEKCKTEFKLEKDEMRRLVKNLESELEKFKPKKTYVGNEWCNVCTDCSVKITNYESEIQILQSKLNERNRTIQSLDLRGDSGRLNEVGTKLTTGRRGKSLQHRARSLSPNIHQQKSNLDLARKVTVSEKKVATLNGKLKETENELTEVKKAHERRLSRFKSLQQEMILLREQLRTYEMQDSNWPNVLNDEDSAQSGKRFEKDQTKKLEQMKKENRQLLNQKIELQETIDRLRVERARDSALMKDLQQDLAAQLNTTNTDLEVKKWMDQCKDFQAKIFDLEDELKSMNHEKDAIARECNAVTEQLEFLRKSPSSTKSTKSRKSKKMKTKSANKSFSSRSNKSGPRLNLSLLRTLETKSTTNDERDNQYEELSDWTETENVEFETTGTANSSRSLGRRIQEVAKANRQIDKAVRNMSSQTDIDLSNVTTLAHLVDIMSNSATVTPRTVTTLETLESERESLLPPSHRNTTKGSSGASKSDSKGGKKVNTSNASYRAKQSIKNLKSQLSAVGEKCETLTEQNSVLRSAKLTLQSTIDGLNNQIDKLQQENVNISSKMRCFKSKEQKLQADIDRLEQEKDELKQKCDKMSGYVKSESDMKNMETRLRNAQAEVCRLKQEVRCVNEEKDAKIEDFQNVLEKVGRLERDITQKRTLIESLRFKIKTFEENAKNDLKQQNELDAKTQSLKETSESAKRTIENLRNQLAHYKNVNIESVQKIEKLQKQLKTAECRKLEVESFASKVENVATSQLEGLASESEAVIEKLQSQLKDAGVIVKEFINVIRAFANELVSKVSKESRELSTKKLQHHRSAYSKGMLAARSKAAEILDLSTDDIDEIMSPNDSGIEIYSKTEAWRTKVEEVLNSKAPFANEMLQVLLEVLSEHTRVTTEAALLQFTDESSQMKWNWWEAMKKNLGTCPKHHSLVINLSKTNFLTV